MSAPKVVEVSLKVGSFSNIVRHRWLYLPDENRFAKGWCHKGAKWGCDYRLVVPIKVVLFELEGYKDTQGLWFRLYEERYDEEGKIADAKKLAEFHLLPDEVVELADSPTTPKALQLFFKATPWRYHTVPSNPPYEVKFDSDEIERIIKFLELFVKSRAEPIQLE
jgi:hypothetical protein